MKATRIFAYSVATLWLLALFGSASAADDFPGKQIQVIVPSGPGGGMDRMVRQVAPFVEKRLGTNLVVKNIEGGAFAVGTVSAYQAAADCKTLLSTYEPQHALTYLVQSVPYDGDSFMPIASLVKADTIIYVKNEARWKTLKDLIDDARANPGKIRLGASTAADPGYFAAKALEKATGVQFNLIAYNGGTAFRNAFRGGEVDVASNDTFASVGFKGEVRILAAFTGSKDPLLAGRNPLTGEDVPSVNSELGVDIKASFSTSGAMYVKKGCFTDHPDRYKLLMKAILEASSDPGYKEVLQKVGEDGKIFAIPGPEYEELDKAELSALLPVLRELGISK